MFPAETKPHGAQERPRQQTVPVLQAWVQRRLREIVRKRSAQANQLDVEWLTSSQTQPEGAGPPELPHGYLSWAAPLS